MPIYEYACTPCGEVFEELVIRSSDGDEIVCPRCKSAKVSRVMSRPAAARTGDGGAPGARRPARGCGPVG
jgi:putative FmdB family regulatory protein